MAQYSECQSGHLQKHILTLETQALDLKEKLEAMEFAAPQPTAKRLRKSTCKKEGTRTDVGSVTRADVKDVTLQTLEVNSKGSDADYEGQLLTAQDLTGDCSRVLAVVNAGLQEQREANAEGFDEDECPESQDEGWADIVCQAWYSVSCCKKTLYFHGKGWPSNPPLYAVQRAAFDVDGGDVVSGKATDIVFSVFKRSGDTWEEVYVSLNGTSNSTVTLAPEMLACYAP